MRLMPGKTVLLALACALVGSVVVAAETQRGTVMMRAAPAVLATATKTPTAAAAIRTAVASGRRGGTRLIP